LSTVIISQCPKSKIGDRPIARVPPSCFAMGNLSPFHQGSGSVQLLSVCQAVPSGDTFDLLLTGLRADSVTAEAPGIFREIPTSQVPLSKNLMFPSDWTSGTRLPCKESQILFSVVDQGDLDNRLLPVGEGRESMVIGPELLHLSRFAERYRFYPDEHLPSRVELCMHNSQVAQSLNSPALAQMWKMVASLLKFSKINSLRDVSSPPKNVMQYSILPTIESLLEERANAGDVQTCVALCEVLEVLTSDQVIRLPSLEITIIREWYLTYIDLLRDMCLFSQATQLIRNCRDPNINVLNQQSTTYVFWILGSQICYLYLCFLTLLSFSFYESCPQCGKAILTGEGAGPSQDSAFRRQCKNCRARLGMCFLCHELVKGLFVWCPGCGTFVISRTVACSAGN
jgi:WD repeat-containing protein 24